MSAPRRRSTRCCASSPADGVAIIVISSEFNELLALCGRLAIVRDGRIRGVVANRGLDEHVLMEMVTGAAELPTAAA